MWLLMLLGSFLDKTADEMKQAQTCAEQRRNDVDDFPATGIKLGKIIKITEFHGKDYYYEIPVIHIKSGRQIGDYDIDFRSGAASLERTGFHLTKLKHDGRITNEDLTEENLKKLPRSTLEMTPQDIIEAIKLHKLVGFDDVFSIQSRELVFDGFETRVCWAVTVENNGSARAPISEAPPKKFECLVTPRFAYLPYKHTLGRQ